MILITQENFLFTGSIADNIELGKPGASRAEIVAAARAIGAHTFIADLPNGYDEQVGKSGGRLSAGQRQLISFARAFLAAPAVLVLDEATSLLDIPSERLVQDALSDDPGRAHRGDHRAPAFHRRDRRPGTSARARPHHRGRPPEDLLTSDGEYSALHASWQESLA